MGAGVAALVDSTGFAPSSRRGGLESTGELRAQVARWRGMGAGWQAIGRMLGGYCANDVRAVFDPDWAKPDTPVQVASVATGRLACLSTDAQRVLAALSGRARTSGALGSTLALTSPKTTAALKALRDAGLAERHSTGRWDLTMIGRREAAGLACAAARRLSAETLKVLAALAGRAHGPRMVAQLAQIAERPATAALVELRGLGFAERRTNGTYAVTGAGRDAAALAVGVTL